MEVKKLFENSNKYLNKNVEINGWVRLHRKQREFGFIDFSDGTCFKHIQVVYDNKLKNFDDISKILVGSTINVQGKFVKSSGNQDYEIQATKVTLLGDCPEDYPIQPKRHTREFLREQAYLRPRTNLFQAVFRIRSLAAMAIHEYFQNNGFVYVHTPLITASDCEGAGEMFQVTTLDLNRVAKEGKVNYDKDFFGKQAGLTVSGQTSSKADKDFIKELYDKFINIKGFMKDILAAF